MRLIYFSFRLTYRGRMTIKEADGNIIGPLAYASAAAKI